MKKLNKELNKKRLNKIEQIAPAPISRTPF